MAREGRNVLAILFKNIIDSLKPKQFRGNLMGKDYLGNKYFEIPKSRGRNSRWYVPQGLEEDKFDEKLPAEWEAWLRHRRRDPPTEQEISENLALMKSKKIKAAEIDAKFGTKQVEPGSQLNFPTREGLENFPGSKPDSTN